MVVCNVSRFSAKIHYLPQNETPETHCREFVNLANTYKTILVVFYKHFKILK